MSRKKPHAHACVAQLNENSVGTSLLGYRDTMKRRVEQHSTVMTQQGKENLAVLPFGEAKDIGMDKCTFVTLQFSK